MADFPTNTELSEDQETGLYFTISRLPISEDQESESDFADDKIKRMHAKRALALGCLFIAAGSNKKN